MAGISVELMPDAGAPQVGITIDGLDSATSSVISVEVSWDDGVTWAGVRDARHISVLEATFKRDHVPPLNVAARYRLVVHSGAVTPATTEATITVPSDTAWLQDPLAPRTAVAVRYRRDADAIRFLGGGATGSTFRRSQPADRVSVEGARLPVASTGMRQAPSGVPLHLRALAQTQGALVKALRKLFDDAGTLVLRGLPADLPLDAVAHVIAGDVVEVPVVGGRLGFRNDWRLVVDQVRPPGLSIVVPWWTYDQVKAAWATWATAEAVAGSYDDVLAARPGDTYLDWLRSPEPS